MIIRSSNVATALKELAIGIRDGLGMMCAEGVDVDDQMDLQISMTIVRAPNGIERVVTTVTPDKTTTVTPSPDVTQSTNTESRVNSGGSGETQTYTYESDS